MYKRTIYGYATGFTRDKDGNPIMTSTRCTKEKYEEERRINWQTAYKYKVDNQEEYNRIVSIIGELKHNKIMGVIQTKVVEFQGKEVTVCAEAVLNMFRELTEEQEEEYREWPHENEVDEERLQVFHPVIQDEYLTKIRKE